jgi:2-polyprenyl-6-methoxyphenol hydroxylase-like FAD-dependent oxidoreductase
MPADPRATLQRQYADLGWAVPHALAHCPDPPRLYYDLVAQIEMPAWHRGRVALVGDACQAVSLLAGQGASMAMAGAYALANALAAADVPAALQAYERQVKPVIENKQAAGRRMANWFVPGSLARIRVRDLVLRLASLRALEWLVRPVLTTPSGNLVDREAGTPRDTPAI